MVSIRALSARSSPNPLLLRFFSSSYTSEEWKLMLIVRAGRSKSSSATFWRPCRVSRPGRRTRAPHGPPRHRKLRSQRRQTTATYFTLRFLYGLLPLTRIRIRTSKRALFTQLTKQRTQRRPTKTRRRRRTRRRTASTTATPSSPSY